MNSISSQMIEILEERVTGLQKKLTSTKQLIEMLVTQQQKYYHYDLQILKEDKSQSIQEEAPLVYELDGSESPLAATEATKYHSHQGNGIDVTDTFKQHQKQETHEEHEGQIVIRVKKKEKKKGNTLLTGEDSTQVLFSNELLDGLPTKAEG